MAAPKKLSEIISDDEIKKIIQDCKDELQQIINIETMLNLLNIKSDYGENYL